MAIKRDLSDAELKALRKEVQDFQSIAKDAISQLNVAKDLSTQYTLNMRDIRDLTDETGTILKDANPVMKKRVKLWQESADLTKEVVQNAVNLGTEEFRTFNIAQKLAKARRDGNDSTIRMLELAKDISSEHEKQHKLLTSQAALFGQPLKSLDTMIKQIPIIGDLLSASLGLEDIADDMVNTFKATAAQKLLGKQAVEVDVTPTVEDLNIPSQTVDVATAIEDKVNVPIDGNALEKEVAGSLNKASVTGGKTVGSSIKGSIGAGVVEGVTSGAFEAANDLSTRNPFEEKEVFSIFGKVKDFFIKPKVKNEDELQLESQDQIFKTVSADLLKVLKIEADELPTLSVEKASEEAAVKVKNEEPVATEVETVAVKEPDFGLSGGIDKAKELSIARQGVVEKEMLKAGKSIKDLPKVELFTSDWNKFQKDFAGMGKTSTEVSGEWNDWGRASLEARLQLDAMAEEAAKTAVSTEESVDKTEEMKKKTSDVSKAAEGVLSRINMFPIVIGAAAVVMLKLLKNSYGVTKELGTSVDHMKDFASMLNPAAVIAFAKEFGTIENLTAASALNLKVMSYRFGVSAENAAKLTKAMRTLTTDGTGRMIEDMMIFNEELQRAGKVAPAQVMEDLAANTEAFAKFGKDGGKNILYAAAAAAKLGISVGDIATTAESLLDFESSIEKQFEAQILLGRNINLEKARQLAWDNDLVGLGEELVRLVGSEAEWNDMNVIKRNALSDALGMNIEKISSVIGAQSTVNDLTAQQMTIMDVMGNTVDSIWAGFVGMAPVILGIVGTLVAALPAIRTAMSGGLSSAIDTMSVIKGMGILAVGTGTGIAAGVALQNISDVESHHTLKPGEMGIGDEDRVIDSSEVALTEGDAQKLQFPDFENLMPVPSNARQLAWNNDLVGLFETLTTAVASNTVELQKISLDTDKGKIVGAVANLDKTTREEGARWRSAINSLALGQ